MADKNPLENYVQVNERIQKFYEQYPDGRLTDDIYRGRTPGEVKASRIGQQPWEILELGDKTFIVYYAVAYRTPEDTLPGRGVAWEPFPGPTPFTKDSELMNAQTAAWGRALAAIGIEVQKGIATQEDIKAREKANGSRAKKRDEISPAQADFARKLKKKAGIDDDSFSVLLKTRFEVESGRVEDLPWKRFDNLKTFLESDEARLPVKVPGETDVPADMDGLPEGQYEPTPESTL